MDLHTILIEALDDERKTEATYAAIIERFGQVRPFTNIVDAEARHSRAIERQMERLGIAVPENGRVGKGAAPATLAAACEGAIVGELENIALYDRLLPQISDVTARSVLANLRDASRDNHLPAFRRCLARESGTTDGGSAARGPRGGRGYGRFGNGGRDGR
ncbi:DUF2202 domain-containing protein [uncultured Rhodoblastus sp.]|uniref:ferritin-like domain-containing protein n=1 Tax=uncultured Rhodoblastus sp. TaxID=543037 RepID=UPI0025DE98DE|nr:DUF2202 domain-containing protein [uncultured Rhodoblastus sp.]